MCAHSIKTKVDENLNYNRGKSGVDNLIYRKNDFLLRGISVEAALRFEFNI